jgi:hypothetical protein
MPAEGQAWPIDDDWRERVERALGFKGWTRSELARRSGCGRSTITQLLDPKYKIMQSPYVPRIEAALGWSPRIPIVLEPEAGEVLELFKAMDALDRVRWIERGKALLDESKPDGDSKKR